MSDHRIERDRFLDLLTAEIDRRRLAEQGGDPHEALIQKLDEMAERLLADPNYCPPTPAQQRKSAHELEMWFKRNGYG